MIRTMALATAALAAWAVAPADSEWSASRLLPTAIASTDAAGVEPDTVGNRYIVRLADGTARTRLLAEVIGQPLTLDARHERLVRGLRSIHDAAYAEAGDALASARSVGAVTEIDRLWIVNAVVTELDPAAVAALRADPTIAEVVPDRRLSLGAFAGGGDPEVSRLMADPSDEIAFLNVPEVWAQGVTGKGAIVANVDTGVNADDETLGDRWRGYFAGSDATWYAPVPLTVFPTDEDDLFGFGHGTATMGLLTGGEESYGVAFDATWIAGDVFEEREGWVSNALKILEWMTDPDGDPSTRSDVPDVVSNSYGLEDVDETGRVRCDPIFNEAIDALEAAGAIVIWSAGNVGPTGVTSPANRADSPVNAFAVGGIDLNRNPVPSSGRGPSRCGGAHAVKPEVVAPGQDVLTRNRFGQFTRLTGTSFATPLVGGVLALMRSKNPTITPEAAKTILLETASDIAPAGDDNQTGFGLVDAAAALARVQRPSQPLARLVGYRPPDLPGKLGGASLAQSLILRPGSTHSLRPLLSNHGPAIGETQATLSTPTPGVSVTGATVSLSAAQTGTFFGPEGGEDLVVHLDPSVPPGTPIVLDLAIQDAPIGPFRMIVPAGEPIAGDFATHDRGRALLTVTNFGSLGYYTGIHQGRPQLEGQGFRFPANGPSWLFHAGFMAGTSSERLSDAIPYGEDTQNSSDFVPLWGFPITTDQAAGGQRITTGYDDRKAPEPVGLDVEQRSYAFDDEPFVLVQYIVTNTGDRPLGGLRLGLFADWDLPGTGIAPTETAGWDPQRRLGFVQGSNQEPFLGVTWLDNVPLGQVTYTVLERDEIMESTKGNPVSPDLFPAAAPPAFEGEFSDAEKWDALTSGQSKTSVTQPQDLWQVIGVGPVTLAAGATDTVAVALVAGESRSALEAAAEAAREAYFTRVVGTEPPPPPSAPEDLALLQNFPNPFRSGESTTVRFDVPDDPAVSGGRLDLAVYDVSGRRVVTLRSGDATGGEQAASWDGRDDGGRPVPAGVYVIRLIVGGQDRSVRALVLP